MSTSELTGLRFAYESRGSGSPIVLLHGMTFSRATWEPIVDRLAEDFRCIAVDLPGHGQTTASPVPIPEVAAAVHDLLGTLGVERPVIVGHSAAAHVALAYAASFPVSGVVDVDSPVDIRTFAGLVHKLAPGLRGEKFDTTFEPFRSSIGIDLLPEPERSRVAATQTISQDVVLSSWEEILGCSPDELQRLIDARLDAIDAPCLAIFGHTLEDDDRQQLLARLPQAELEEWPGRGHMVHLAEPDRFAHRLSAFVSHVSQPGRPYNAELASNRALLAGMVGRCLDQHDLDALHLYTDDVRVRESVTSIVTGFPDLRCSTEWVIADGDKASTWLSLAGTHAGKWRGIAATGRSISARGSITVRVSAGRVVDFWLAADWLRIYGQLDRAPISGDGGPVNITATGADEITTDTLERTGHAVVEAL